jgi:hypothetical protein
VLARPVLQIREHRGGACGVSPSRNTNRGMPRCWSDSCSSSVWDSCRRARRYPGAPLPSNPRITSP